MVFIVAAYSSLTRRLYDAAAKDSSNAFRVPVAVEGPYGHQPDLEGVDTLLLVGGGTGVAHVQAWWEGLVAGEEKARSSVRKLQVAWIVREERESFARNKRNQMLTGPF
jgi:NAD(P)H-flavin reductase